MLITIILIELTLTAILSYTWKDGQLTARKYIIRILISLILTLSYVMFLLARNIGIGTWFAH